MKRISWVTRVSLSIKQAQELVSNLAEDKLKESRISGYRYQEIGSNYAGIKQRWLVLQLVRMILSFGEKLPVIHGV